MKDILNLTVHITRKEKTELTNFCRVNLNLNTSQFIRILIRENVPALKAHYDAIRRGEQPRDEK